MTDRRQLARVLQVRACRLRVLEFGDRFVRDDTRIIGFGVGAGTGEMDGNAVGDVNVLLSPEMTRET